MDRRLDIQGLRGVAVIAVILYHFGIPPISGGFVGVDVFFVISGYLMTGIILTQAEAGTWGYGAFFLRRIRRLFPALFATAAAVFAVGVLVFAAFDLERLAAVSVLVPLGLSNIFFWAEAGYFDSEAIRKPLLHTWSLAVEIQFYLVWPFVILLGARFGRLGLGVLIMLVAMASFGAGLWMMRTDPTGAFFMMPLRGYEFALGGLTYLIQRHIPRHKVLTQGLYGGALAALILVLVSYSKVTPFPGWTTLPVIVATAVLLWIGPAASLSRIVSNKPLSVLGDISYSAYLVHWPVVVFAQYLMAREASPLETTSLLVVVALATAALFYGVEQPLRHSANVVWRHWRVSTLVAMLALALPMYAWVKNGWPGRSPDALYSLNTLDMQAMEKSLWPYFASLQVKQDYTQDKTNVLVIGDSQAADYVNVLAALDAETDVDLITRNVFTTCNIPYLEGDRLKVFLETQNPYSIKDPNLLTQCPQQMETVVSGAAWNNADAVVLAYAWRDVSMTVMATSFAQLAARTDAPLYAVGNKTLNGSPVQLANQLGTTEGLGAYGYKNIRHWTPPTNVVIAEDENVTLIDILSMFCTKDDCHMLNADGRPLLWDETHFSEWGARFVADRGGRAKLMPFAN